MGAKLYAFLVGINEYKSSDIPTLEGCVNDITAFQSYLEKRQKSKDFKLAKPHVLTNDKASRKNIIDGFQTYLTQAGPDDIALFYYSGHGSQEIAPKEFLAFEPDGMNETLVCHDSRTRDKKGNDIYDLADKELAFLLAEVAKKQPHLVVIFDCCHSGSGTRAPEESGNRARNARPDARKRNLNDYLFKDVALKNFAAKKSPRDLESSGWFKLPKSEHVLLAACRSSQTAKEVTHQGKERGAFSAALLEVLQTSGVELTYNQLMGWTSNEVTKKVQNQIPQLEPSQGKGLNQTFLKGAIQATESHYLLRHSSKKGWTINAGTLHGLQAPKGNETTVLAIFEHNAKDTRDLKKALTTVTLTGVELAESSVKLAKKDKLKENRQYLAVIGSQPLPKHGVVLEGDAAGVKLLRDVLGKAGADGKSSSNFVREVKKADEADFRIVARDKTYTLSKAKSDVPLTVGVDDTEGYTKASAEGAIKRLEHMARWQTTFELSNPGSPLTGKMKLRVYLQDPNNKPSGKVKPEPETKELRLTYADPSDEGSGPTFWLELENTASKPLHYALVNMGIDFSVGTDLMPGTPEPLAPKEKLLVMEGTEIKGTLSHAWWEQGVTEIKDKIKLIVSDELIPVDGLKQEGLDVVFVPREIERVLGTTNTLELLLNRVGQRSLSVGTANKVAEWTITDLIVTTVRPRLAEKIPSKGKTVELTNVRVKGHSGLGKKAKVRLVSQPQASRDLGNMQIAPIFRQEAGEPVAFTRSRGDDPGLRVLELSDLDKEALASVTSKNPLELELTVSLGKGEYLLPVAFDPKLKLYVPLGIGEAKDGKTEVRLERLPDPVSEGDRSLGGSIKIFFHKVVSSIIGIDFPYPLLRVATVDDTGKVSYSTPDPKVVKAKIDAAKNVVLYVHGIIGDTLGMAASARPGLLKLSKKLLDVAGQKDTVLLTFDYENINTGIEKTAEALEQRLAEVGLKPGHTKKLTIVAHSMGGLVSRWFIEKLTGNQVASQLVMLGTPNKGSPWPKIQDLLTLGITVGINGLAAVAWPLSLLGALVGSLEKVDTALDQMKADAEFLKTLNSGSVPNPKIPYTVIAGNTSLQPSEYKKLVSKLMQGAANAVFFKQPNDIAVGVTSVHGVQNDRASDMKKLEVGCDHMSYFFTLEGLEALTHALT